MWITANWKIVRDGNTRSPLAASWETCMQVRKQQLEPDVEQWTGSKSGKEYVKAVYCHPDYLTYIHHQHHAKFGLDEAQARIKIVNRNINNLRMQMTPP